MAPQRLTGPEIGRLAKLLGAAFEPDDFDGFLQDHLDYRVHEFAGAADKYPVVLRKVVTQANAKLWWSDLVFAALEEVPTDSGLIDFAKGFGPGTRVHDGSVGPVSPLWGRRLELKIEESGHDTVDVMSWRTRLADLETRVCRVECPKAVGRGTGFLIGAGIVLTNYHVVRDLIAKERPAADAVFRFDFKRLVDRVTVNPGFEYPLAADWLIDSSPISPGDEMIDPPSDPGEEELDYALLRLDGPAADFDRRGWIALPTTPAALAADGPLHILEHPDGDPLQLALHSKSVIGVNGNGTRVRHRTTTEPGSSGSPCFDGDLELVALHHGGDPLYYQGGKPRHNQGIPIGKVRGLITARGKQSALGT